MSHRSKKGKGLAGSAAFVALLVVMLDVWGNMAVSGLVTSMLSTPHVNPPPKNEADKRVPTAPVALFFQTEWTRGMPHDLDMAVRCETLIRGEPTPLITQVNWRQVYHRWLRLSKDDQGLPTPVNIEKIESTSDIVAVFPNTRCAVNIHLYSTHGGPLPIAGELIAVHQKDDPQKQQEIGKVIFSLSDPGEERTLLIATWDQNGFLLKDAVEMYPAICTTPQLTDGRNLRSGLCSTQ